MKKYITKQSSIKGAGKGLFTKDFFKKGEVIGLAHVDDQPASEIGRNHNHNEKNPTAYSKKINNKRFIYASRNLKPGEEITTNYRMQPELEQPEDFMRKGGVLLTKKVTCKSCGWEWDAEDGGKDITTCHKCGGQGLIHAQKGGESKCLNGQVWSKKDKKCIDLPVFGNSLNSGTFTKSTNLSDGFKIKPLNSFSDFGKIKPKKIPVVEDSFLETLEKDINDFLENPLKKAAQVSESLKEKGEDPSDALRHSTAGALTAQTIANKTGNIPFISNPLGYLGANIAGIGHELSTLSQAYLDDRPWSVKLQESLEDIYNNSAGANTIFNNNSEKDKINYLLKLTRTNQLPDGYGEERPFRDNPKWTDPYNQKQYGGITKLTPEEEKQFQNFYKTLPNNLQSDDDTYDIRGYWDSEQRPTEFDYTQPKNKDGFYHAYSINGNTGEYLKSPAHPTFQHAVDEDRKIGYRPITNVQGRNIAIENKSIADPEEQSFLRNTEGPINYIEADLDENEIEEYRRGGYIVEEIDTYQKGGTVYTVKGSKGYYKKVNGQWQVDWNRSGKYQPLSKGDVKARTAVLDKMAKPVDNGISKVLSNSSDNTRVNYQKPLVESFNRSNNLESFYKKEREKDLQKQKDATAYHDKTQKVKQNQSFGEFLNQDILGIPTLEEQKKQVTNDKKLLKKELKPYFETEKELDQFVNQQYSRPTASAENNWNDGPIQLVYPEKYGIGPGGGMIGNIKNLGINTFNLGKKVLSNPYVSGGLNAYFGTEGIKEFADPNSLTRKSMSRAYDNPTGSNIGDAAFDVGMNSLNFVGLPFNKAIKGSKNLINNTYNAGKGSNIFFNFSNEANAARKLQNEGLLKKNIDPKIFGKYPNLAQNVTKRLLKDYNTTYRAVNPNVKKMGFEDMVNMAKSGYNINDPMQVIEYMTTTIPISNTGAYRAGLDLHPLQDALYTGKFKTPEEAFKNLKVYGNYMAAVRPKMDFSKGTLNEWIDQYYTNKLFALNKNPNKGFFALRNPKAYASGSLFKPGAVGFTRENNFWPYIGNKGQKVLEHVKTYNLNQKQKGGTTNDYIELDLTPEEIQKYKDGGYVVEELPEMQSGGSPSQVWYQYTGTPWSEARKKGLTDGSKEQNIKLRKKILAGEFGKPKFSNEKYQNIESNYDRNIEKMVAQGKTLDQLVKQKVGTRVGLKSRFPELFKTKSKLDDFLPKKNNSTSSKTQNKITTPVKNRWGNVTVESNNGKPIYRKDDYIDMVQSKDSKTKAEGLKMQAEHKKQLQAEKIKKQKKDLLNVEALLANAANTHKAQVKAIEAARVAKLSEEEKAYEYFLGKPAPAKVEPIKVEPIPGSMASQIKGDHNKKYYDDNGIEIKPILWDPDTSLWDMNKGLLEQKWFPFSEKFIESQKYKPEGFFKMFPDPSTKEAQAYLKAEQAKENAKKEEEDFQYREAMIKENPETSIEEIDQFIQDEKSIAYENSIAGPHNNYNDGPVQMVYPERVFAYGPSGGILGGLLRNPYVMGAGNLYFGAQGISEWADSDSDLRKSISKAWDDPTWSNIGDFGYELGANALNYIGLPFSKYYKNSRNVTKIPIPKKYGPFKPRKPKTINLNQNPRWLQLPKYNSKGYLEYKKYQDGGNVSKLGKQKIDNYKLDKEIVSDLSKEEINKLVSQGYIVEQIN